MLDEKSRRNIEDLERETGKLSGVGRMDRGECPIGCINTMGCMFCQYGHMLECHYPLTCSEADCSHYQADEDTNP